MIEGKLTENSVALDNINDEMKKLSLKLESAEENIKERKFLVLLVLSSCKTIYVISGHDLVSKCRN